MISRISVSLCFVIVASVMQLTTGTNHNWKANDIIVVREKLFSGLNGDEKELLQSIHPVMVLAVSAYNDTISKIIETYLQTFDPVLLSDETCSKSLRTEAWRCLRRKTKDSLHCLRQLNSQLLATSVQQKNVSFKDCLGIVERESIDKLKSFTPTVKLCTYFMAIPVQSVNLDPTGLTDAIRKSWQQSD